MKDKTVKTARRIFLFVIILFTVCACKEQPENENISDNYDAVTPEITLILSGVNSEDYPTTLADREFARLVRIKSKGRIKVEVHIGGELYAQESGEVEALKSGEISFARLSCDTLESYVTKMRVFKLPYIFRDRTHMWKVLNGSIGQSVLNELQTSGSGLVGLSYYDIGARNFYTTTSVHSAGDFNGLKIRTQNVALMKDIASALEATPITGIGPKYILSKIEDGSIDGAESNLWSYYVNSDYEGARYYCYDGHTRTPDVLVASEKALKSLSEEDIKIIKDAAKEAQSYEIEEWTKKENSIEEDLIKQGVVFYTSTEAEWQGFKNKMFSLYTSYGVGFETLIEEIYALD